MNNRGMESDAAKQKAESKENKSHSDYCKNNPNDKPAGNGESSATPMGIAFDAPKHDCAQTDQKRNYTKKESPNWVEVLTVWLEVVGIVGLIFYCWVNFREWQVFDSERRTMEIEFQASQKVSERQIHEMQRERILDQRAWVAPFEMITESEDSIVTNSTVIFLKFRNTGKTPALNVSEVHHSSMNLNDIPTNKPVIPPATFLLAPDGVFWIKTERFPNQLIAAIKNGWAQPMYVYGEITYDDIFGNHHWTEFCWGVESGLNFRPASVHNSCDGANDDKNN